MSNNTGATWSKTDVCDCVLEGFPTFDPVIFDLLENVFPILFGVLFIYLGLLSYTSF